MNPLVFQGADASRPATALSVNLNKVALLRNQRNLTIPGVVRAAELVLDAGAHGITVHPRPDERHIRASDVRELSVFLQGRPGVEYNIEGNPFHNLMDLLRELAAAGAPCDQATFVPDAVGQSTSDHGWDLAADGARLAPLIAECHALGVRVSLFMDPDPDAMAAARALGADRVELYTEAFARSHLGHRGEGEAHAALVSRYAASAEAALHAGLGVNAGHDLNRDNLADFIAAVPGVQEVSIGHALIADALELGLAQAVHGYLRCIAAGLAAKARA
ncbi:MAG TPA: pyridoxine 5'-phosphate synthase [Methylibium sp.]|uniref:pyridoxine 5'-phosphate synthase n=1 Tax=Methylibium sp. TaxID=2067992 RepID=UPI002DB8B6F7|nr:pyridoxine 5'-phosphate synthase [Methylibium sp.]HEU4458652.1 pyridoxine 5'-phosphate synthase [Methylibium sp.]